MRRRIKELEASLGVSGAELAKQEADGTIATDPQKMELAMMVSAYTSERDFIASQGQALGTSAVIAEEELDSKNNEATQE